MVITLLKSLLYNTTNKNINKENFKNISCGTYFTTNKKINCFPEYTKLIKQKINFYLNDFKPIGIGKEYEDIIDIGIFFDKFQKYKIINNSIKNINLRNFDDMIIESNIIQIINNKKYININKLNNIKIILEIFTNKLNDLNKLNFKFKKIIYFKKLKIYTSFETFFRYITIITYKINNFKKYYNFLIVFDIPPYLDEYPNKLNLFNFDDYLQEFLLISSI